MKSSIDCFGWRVRHCLFRHKADVCEIYTFKDVWNIPPIFLICQSNSMSFYKFQSTHCFLMSPSTGTAWGRIWLTKQIIMKEAWLYRTSKNFYTLFYASTLFIIFWKLEIFQADQADFERSHKTYIKTTCPFSLKLIWGELYVLYSLVVNFDYDSHWVFFIYDWNLKHGKAN